MTHSVLDSMLPRMNTQKNNVENVKWFTDEGKLKAKLQKTMDFYIVYYIQVELRHDNAVFVMSLIIIIFKSLCTLIDYVPIG